MLSNKRAPAKISPVNRKVFKYKSKIVLLGDVTMKAMEVQVTTTSPRGQVVIPQEIREGMRIEAGTRFAVYGRGDTIIFKRVELPTVKDFEKLARFGSEFARKKGIKEEDVLKGD